MSDSTDGNALCRSCGLCCTGHLFIWVKLRPAELDPAEALGMKVFRSEPNQRGFSQPCPVWKSECTIYNSPRYPHACRTYRCSLLKAVAAEGVSLPEALTIVQDAKQMIRQVELLLASSSTAGTSPNPNFRERLVAELEGGTADPELRAKARALLDFYETIFGVTDLVDHVEEE